MPAIVFEMKGMAGMTATGGDDHIRAAFSLTMRLVQAVDAADPIGEALGAVCAALGVGRAHYYTRNPADRTLSATHSTETALFNAAVAVMHHEGDASIAAQTLQLGQPVIRAPFRSSPDEERAVRARGIDPMRNIASLPVIVDATALGVLQLVNVPPDVLTGDTIPLADVAALFGNVLQSARQRRELTMLGDTILQVNRSLDLHDTFDSVLAGLMTLVPSVSTAIYLDSIIPDVLARVAEHASDTGTQYPASQPRPLIGSLTGWVYMHRTAVNAPDLYYDPRVLRSGPDALPPDTDIRSYIMAPMLVQGEPVGVLVCARDLAVVEQFALLAAQAVSNARAYEEAEHGRERLEVLVGDIADAVVRIGLDNRVIGWNRGAERLLGCTAAEMLGQYPPVTPLESDVRYAGFYARVLAGESFVNLGNRQRHKDGHWLDTLISLSPLRERGEIISVMAVIRDITPLKQLQTQLRAEVALNMRRARDETYIASVAQACNSAEDGLAILQALADFTADWGDAAIVVTFAAGQGTLAAHASRTSREDATITPHLRSYMEILTAHLFKSGQRALSQPGVINVRDVIPEHCPIIATARAREYHTFAYAPISAGNETVGVLGAAARGETPPFDAQSLETMRLVAEQAGLAITKDRLLKQVEAQVRALEQASRHKDDFLASLSHELRTPLNAILGFGEMLTDGLLTDPDEAHQAMEDIVGSGRLLLEQVNNLLDMARVEAGQLTVLRSDVPLPPLLYTCERVLLPLITAKRQRLCVLLSPDLPPVRADAERLRQVMLNLLTNAHKFTPAEGKITVTGTQRGNQVMITVRDTGIGIAPEHAALVFEPFRRVETGYARKQGGTGLGLALCRRLVELMGGTLSLESIPDGGSTFSVCLPVAVSDGQPEAAVADAAIIAPTII